MADYLALAVSVFVVNMVPIFMPPTWFVLAYAMLKDASFDPLWVTVVGAFASTAGRAVLAFYSAYVRRFFTKELADRADEIKKFLNRKKRSLFVGSFVYSLSPFPSSVLFIADGLTKVDPKPLFAGYFLGRLISYYTLVTMSHNLAGMLARYLQNDASVRHIFDAFGILAAFSIVLIDWRKVAGLKKADEKK